MLITVQGLDGPNQSDKGSWQELEVTFTKDDGSNGKKRLVSFGNGKDLFESFSNGDFTVGDVLNIVVKKNGKYWDWVSAEKTSGEAAPKAAAKPAGKSGGWQPDTTRETPEERYKRNLTICRQNAVSSSIAFLTHYGNGNADPIFELAERIFDWTTQDIRHVEEIAKKLTQDTLK